jgi:hypothetical protein
MLCASTLSSKTAMATYSLGTAHGARRMTALMTIEHVSTSMLVPAERRRPAISGTGVCRNLLAVDAFEARAKGWTAKTSGGSGQKEHEITTLT